MTMHIEHLDARSLYRRARRLQRIVEALNLKGIRHRSPSITEARTTIQRLRDENPRIRKAYPIHVPQPVMGQHYPGLRTRHLPGRSGPRGQDDGF